MRSRHNLLYFLFCFYTLVTKTQSAPSEAPQENTALGQNQAKPPTASNEGSGEPAVTGEENGGAVFTPPPFSVSDLQSDEPFEGVSAGPADHEVQALSESDVASLNTEDLTWQAVKYDEFEGIDLRTKCGTIMDADSFKTLPTIVHAADTTSDGAVGADDIPAFFDSRTKWPNCHTITNIRDQGQCGSCWAVAAASVMSDRICIHRNKDNVNIASTDLINCCGTKCAPNKGDGCQGGFPDQAFNYWKGTGLPTEQCEKYVPSFGSCTKRCDTTTPLHSDDVRLGSSSYRIKNDVKEIQREIMKFGPVECAFDVSQDFMNYKSGVYQHKSGEIIGGHAMRVIGWGEEGGNPYWLIANSWGTGWGENGLVKFLRGSNHMNIESWIATGTPK